MSKKHYRQAISSLQARIREHQINIQQELDEDIPAPGLMRHWQKDIAAFEKRRQQAHPR